MPELPEVETIRRGLEKRIVGKVIADIEVLVLKSLEGDKSKVVGYRVKSIGRRAKVIAIRLENGYNLLFHLKMTGQLIYRGSSVVSSLSTNDQRPTFDQFAGGHPDHEWHAKLPNKTTAIIFTFNDKSRLFFNDMRKFGWCKVLTDDQLEKVFKEDYGPEPLDSSLSRAKSRDSGQANSGEEFTAEYLMRQAAKIPNRNAKQFLTDQKIIAGIGNIYVDEILFECRISPLRKVRDIKLSEWKNIIENTKKVLEKGIKYGGTTDSDYVNAEGKKGGMQDHLNVYHRTGQPCPAGCGGKVERITVGGRGTHYCPVCQS